MGPSLPHIHALSLPMGNGQPRALSPSHPHPLAAHGKRTATGPPSLTFTASRSPRETDCHGLSLPHIHALSLPMGNGLPRALPPSHSPSRCRWGTHSHGLKCPHNHPPALPTGNGMPRALAPSHPRAATGRNGVRKADGSGCVGPGRRGVGGGPGARPQQQGGEARAPQGPRAPY